MSWLQICFNPLPSPKQGETPTSSIHPNGQRSFNPLPSPKQGETSPSSPSAPGAPGFNPLPSPKQGETELVQQDCCSCRCFNPLPSPKQGETDLTDGLTGFITVSIRSPHRSKGRQINQVRYPQLPLFQSAPLTEARGDTCVPTFADQHLCFNPLPSPKQGETEWCYPGRPGWAVSIRSPHRSKGRHSSKSVEGGEILVSIRSPHRSKGRPSNERSATRSSPVSIRSPHRSKGRPIAYLNANDAVLFQSAPLTEARGDIVVEPFDFDRTRFNPLPSPKQGETSRLLCASPTRLCFNPLPSPKQGETW